MDRNIESYVKVYNIFDKEKCELSVKLLEEKEKEFRTHEFYDVTNNTYHSYEHELSVSYSQIETKEYFMEETWNGISKYLKELNFEWFGSWKGYSEIRFNRYRTDTQMAQHCDHIHSMFDGNRKGIPTLSIVGVLNEDYEGGEFIMWEDTEIKLKTGDVLIFPSNFLYPHKVDLVTKGTRYSLVSWVW
jgi:hypothetical protein